MKEARARRFWIVVERVVRKVLCWLARWKCPLCAKSFTEYPAFALPYKRYAREEILNRSGRYVEEDKTTCLVAAQDRGMVVCHAIESERKPERHLAASTVWRWAGWMGSLKKTLRSAMDLIRQKSSTHRIFRACHAGVALSKYRSRQRRLTLERCREMLSVERVYRSFFGVSSFPRFATAGPEP